MTKVMCDACFQMIEVGGYETATVERDIQKLFFNCPECGHEYLIRYDNAKARTLMAAQRKIYGRQGSLLEPNIGKRYERNKAEIKRICDELKARYAGDVPDADVGE